MARLYGLELYVFRFQARAAAVLLMMKTKIVHFLQLMYTYGIIMPRAEAYGSSFVCLSVIMPRAELRRHTVIVLSVSQSVFYKYFSSLTEN